MNAWTKCPECSLTHGRHAPGCPADAWYRGRLAAEAALGESPLNRAVKAVQAAAQLGTGIWQIHYEPRGPVQTTFGTAGGAGSAPDDTATRRHDGTTTQRHGDTATRRHDGAKPDVTNPGHYRAHPSGVECITITEHMGFNLGNAVKYIWRADLKHETPVDDLKKARWYLDREIARRGG